MKGQGNLSAQKVQIQGKTKKPPPKGWLESQYFVFVPFNYVLHPSRGHADFFRQRLVGDAVD